MRGADAALLQWLKEFLYPNFYPSDAESGNAWSFNIVPSKHLENEVSLVSDATCAVPIFTLHNSYDRLEQLPATATGICYFIDRKERQIIGIDSKSKRCTIGVCTFSERSDRYFCMRVIREFASAHALSAGAVALHGAAIASGNKAILLIGPKGAGKSTETIAALLKKKYQFIANDRLYVFPVKDGYEVWGMPTIIKLRKNTLHIFPELLAGIASLGADAARAMHECVATSEVSLRHSIAHSGYRSLSATQLTSLTNTQGIPSAQVAALILLDRPEEQGMEEYCRLSAPEARALLCKNLLVSENSSNEVSALEDFFSDRPTADVLTELSSAIPAYKYSSKISCEEQLTLQGNFWQHFGALL